MADLDTKVLQQLIQQLTVAAGPLASAFKGLTSDIKTMQEAQKRSKLENDRQERLDRIKTAKDAAEDRKNAVKERQRLEQEAKTDKARYDRLVRQIKGMKEMDQAMVTLTKTVKEQSKEQKASTHLTSRNLKILQGKYEVAINRFKESMEDLGENADDLLVSMDGATTASEQYARMMKNLHVIGKKTKKVNSLSNEDMNTLRQGTREAGEAAKNSAKAYDDASKSLITSTQYAKRVMRATLDSGWTKFAGGFGVGKGIIGLRDSIDDSLQKNRSTFTGLEDSLNVFKYSQGAGLSPNEVGKIVDDNSRLMLSLSDRTNKDKNAVQQSLSEIGKLRPELKNMFGTKAFDQAQGKMAMDRIVRAMDPTIKGYGTQFNNAMREVSANINTQANMTGKSNVEVAELTKAFVESTEFQKTIMKMDGKSDKKRASEVNNLVNALVMMGKTLEESQEIAKQGMAANMRNPNERRVEGAKYAVGINQLMNVLGLQAKDKKKYNELSIRGMQGDELARQEISSMDMVNRAGETVKLGNAVTGALANPNTYDPRVAGVASVFQSTNMDPNKFIAQTEQDKVQADAISKAIADTGMSREEFMTRYDMREATAMKAFNTALSGQLGKTEDSSIFNAASTLYDTIANSMKQMLDNPIVQIGAGSVLGVVGTIANLLSGPISGYLKIIAASTAATATGLGSKLASLGGLAGNTGKAALGAALPALGTAAMWAGGSAAAFGAGYGVGKYAVNPLIDKATGGQGLGSKIYDWIHPEEGRVPEKNSVQYLADVKARIAARREREKAAAVAAASQGSTGSVSFSSTPTTGSVNLSPEEAARKNAAAGTDPTKTTADPQKVYDKDLTDRVVTLETVMRDVLGILKQQTFMMQERDKVFKEYVLKQDRDSRFRAFGTP